MKKEERTIAIAAFFITIIVVVLLPFFLPPQRPAPIFVPTAMTLTGGTTTLVIDYAITQAEQQKGLSGTESLPDGRGLLFVFDKPAPPFWMPEMHYAIDIIWIGEDKRIVDITENATPESYPTQFRSTSPAKYDLEIGSGEARKYSWAEGTPLNFDTPKAGK